MDPWMSGPLRCTSSANLVGTKYLVLVRVQVRAKYLVVIVPDTVLRTQDPESSPSRCPIDQHPPPFFSSSTNTTDSSVILLVDISIADLETDLRFPNSHRPSGIKHDLFGVRISRDEDWKHENEKSCTPYSVPLRTNTNFKLLPDATFSQIALCIPAGFHGSKIRTVPICLIQGPAHRPSPVGTGGTAHPWAVADHCRHHKGRMYSIFVPLLVRYSALRSTRTRTSPCCPCTWTHAVWCHQQEVPLQVLRWYGVLVVLVLSESPSAFAVRIFCGSFNSGNIEHGYPLAVPVRVAAASPCPHMALGPPGRLLVFLRTPVDSP